MAEKPGAAVNARIVYWGASQSGVSTILERISTKLRPDHRGELREIPTRLDPTVTYEVLPIKLGEVGGVDTRIEIVAVPGGAEHAPTRKQLLDRADGVVFVADARRECLEESVACFEELRRALAAYGRSPESVPLVIQLNKRDLADASGLQELARKLDAPRALTFETVARDGTGVLQVLSTISKGVVRSLRDQPGRVARPPAAAAPALRPTPVIAARMDAAPVIVAPVPEEWPAPIRAQRAPAPPSPATVAAPSLDDVTGRLEPAPIETPAAVPVSHPATLRVVSVGHGSCDDQHTVLLPLELQDAAGHRFRITLSLAIGPLLTGGD